MAAQRPGRGRVDICDTRFLRHSYVFSRDADRIMWFP